MGCLKMGIKLGVVNTAIYGKKYGVPFILLGSVYEHVMLRSSYLLTNKGYARHEKILIIAFLILCM